MNVLKIQINKFKNTKTADNNYKELNVKLMI